MSIRILNRETVDKFGTGLPFYLYKRYQERFDEITEPGTAGMWAVPQNFLPSFQLKSYSDLVAVKLVQVIFGVEQTPITINLAINIDKKCLTTLDAIYSYLSLTELTFIMPCGTWFYQLEFTAHPTLYSELFLVGGVCAHGFSLSYTILNVQMDLSMNVAFTINYTDPAYIVGYINAVNAVPNFTQNFTANLPNGANAVAISIETEYCGTFAQSYNFQNAAGIKLTPTPIY